MLKIADWALSCMWQKINKRNKIINNKIKKNEFLRKS